MPSNNAACATISIYADRLVERRSTNYGRGHGVIAAVSVKETKPVPSLSDLRQAFMGVRPALIRFLVARGASLDDASDLIQDLYLKLDRVPISSVTDQRAYLYRMAENLRLDRIRSSLRRSRRDEEWTGLQSGIELDRDQQPSADEALIARERLSVANRILDELPSRTSDVFRRFRIDGQTQKDIAAELDISVSAVEKHLQRAYRAVLAMKVGFDVEDGGPCRQVSTDGILDD